MEESVPYPQVGVPIRRIQDAVDIQAAFIEMHAATELLIDKLNNEASTYSKIIDSFNQNHSQYSDMIAALSEEQMNLQQLSGTIEKMSQATALAAQEMLARYQSNVQQTIDNAFKKVDDAAVHRSLQQTIEKSLSRVNTGSIDKAAAAMNDGAAKIDKLHLVLNNTLRDIASGVREFNDTVVKNFNKKALIATGLAALLFGLTIGWIVKSEMTAADYIDWNVDINHRFFDDAKNSNYIRFTQQEAENRGDGYFYVKIKQFSH